ncbi:MAG: flagellar biosynthesis protein FlhB [Pelosinus sp.]|nr:flagellar biosynthesis protein FlhB [Pelosinus sp.]
MECIQTYITSWLTLNKKKVNKADYQLKTLDLQLFNGEKTEDPTAKRQSEAREKGQVAKSMELSSVFIVLAAFQTLKISGIYMYDELYRYMQYMFTHLTTSDFTIEFLQELCADFTIVFLKVCLPVLLVILVVSVIINYLQVGFLFNMDAILPSFDKINLNPAGMFQKMFSKRTLVDLLKSIFKATIFGYLLYHFILQEIDDISKLVGVELIDSLRYSASLMIDLIYKIVAVMLVLGVLDYVFQAWDHKESLKMSKQEVKEENKQVEGNPEIKGKIKERQRALAMRRMMQEVPKASVVVTNPTHFAVALRYEKNMSAPVVVAKGQDLIAQRIKEIAAEYKVVVVENRPVARALYSSVDIGQVVPPDLYQAVAEILAYVYKLKKRSS